MRTIYNISGLLLATCLLASCTRKNEDIKPEPPFAGGKGGKATINVTTQHHEKNIFDSRVFIKYNATKPAADTFGYDDVGNSGLMNGRPFISFSDLKAGDYYIYAMGTDNRIDTSRYNIRGGAHFRVVDTFAKSYDIYIQMDEPGHHVDGVWE